MDRQQHKQEEPPHGPIQQQQRSLQADGPTVYNVFKPANESHQLTVTINHSYMTKKSQVSQTIKPNL